MGCAGSKSASRQDEQGTAVEEENDPASLLATLVKGGDGSRVSNENQPTQSMPALRDSGAASQIN